MRGGERLLQHADHGHDAGDRRLEAQLDAVLARGTPTAPRRAGRAAACSRVTTWRPARIARSTYSRAGSTPPISSTIRSERARMSSNSPRERVSTPLSSGRMPGDRDDRVGALARAAPRTRAPTVPWPSRPTLNVSGTEVLVGLAADDRARLAAGGRRRPAAADAVVVGGHGMAVGAGDRGHQHVAGARLGQRACGARARRRTRSACPPRWRARRPRRCGRRRATS